MTLRVAIDTLGCKLNQAESEAISREFGQQDCSVVPTVEEADVYLLNTCTVTHVADRKARNMMRQARRRNPSVYIVATGCYVSRNGELPEDDLADLMVPNENKPGIASTILDCISRAAVTTSAPKAVAEPDRRKARSFIKIQSGCRNFCTYCIVPRVRGYPRSVPADRVIAEIQARLEEGYREVVLTGTEIGLYSSEGLNLEGLVARLLGETAIPRIRLSSVQAEEVTESLVSLSQDPRVCRHWHIPLQSGSPAVLERMKRRYTLASYLQTVSMIRNSIPGVAITTDVMVGFPGETDREFLESYLFCKDIGFSRIHVFPFSSRPGTIAAKMDGLVPDKAKAERCEQMLLLSGEAQHDFLGKFIGSVLPVLWEERHNGAWTGLTDNYIRVYNENPDDISGEILPSRLLEACPGGARAIIVEAPPL